MRRAGRPQPTSCRPRTSGGGWFGAVPRQFYLTTVMPGGGRQPRFYLHLYASPKMFIVSTRAAKGLVRADSVVDLCDPFPQLTCSLRVPVRVVS